VQSWLEVERGRRKMPMSATMEELMGYVSRCRTYLLHRPDLALALVPGCLDA
jgi:hypothetical protein